MNTVYFTFANCAMQNEKEGCYGVAAAAWEQASLYANNATNVEYAKGRAELNKNRQKIIDNEEEKKREKEDRKHQKSNKIDAQPASVEATCE